MSYRVAKTFGHELGLSACFRQWRADSHCSFLHGYALSIRLTFEASALDHRNWVVSFGDFAPLKEWMRATFDHKTLVAADDPALPAMRVLHEQKVLDLVVVPATGCEAFAQLIGDEVQKFLRTAGYLPRCRLIDVEVREHGANAASWQPEGGTP